MAVKTICFVLVLNIGAAVSVIDYWCKLTSPNGSGVCMLGNSCPAGYTINAYARNLLACMGTQETRHTCCVPNDAAPPTSTIPPTTPPQPECGLFVKDSRILNGEQSAPCRWPWMVGIRGRPLSSTASPSLANTSPLCAGVLIDREWVITTAFCASLAGFIAEPFLTRNIFVVPGEYNNTKIDLDAFGVQREQPRRVSKYFIHPAFPLASSTNFSQILLFPNPEQLTGGNIALLKLAEPVVYTSCVKPACLSKDLNADPTTGAEECFAAGWGLTTSQVVSDVPYEVSTTLYRKEVCEAIALYSDRFTFGNRPATLCSGNKRENARTCIGDNGGMVVCNEKGRWALRGLITQTDLDCDTLRPFTVSNVNAVQDWIDTTMANN